MNHNVEYKRQKYNVPKVDLAITLNSPENLNSMEISKDVMKAYDRETGKVLYSFGEKPKLCYDEMVLNKLALNSIYGTMFWEDCGGNKGMSYKEIERKIKKKQAKIFFSRFSDV